MLTGVPVDLSNQLPPPPKEKKKKKKNMRDSLSRRVITAPGQLGTD